MIKEEDKGKESVYIYRNLDGKEVYRKVKLKYEDSSKSFWFEIKDKTEWRKPKVGEQYKKIPYNLDKFKEHKSVIVCEGEKDADTVESLSLGYLATSTPCGKGSWNDNLTKYFKGKKEITFLYDVGNEEGAKRHAAKIQAIFPKICIYIAKVPLKKREADITDYLNQVTGLKLKRIYFAEIIQKAEKLDEREKAISQESLGKKFSARELLETELPPEQLWISKGLLPERGYMIVAGHAKQGKTILCLQMSLSLISGHPFLDEFPIQKKARILYLFAENTTYGLKEILKKQLEGAERESWLISPEDLERFRFEDSKGLMLNTKAGHEELIKLVKDNDANIVFIDPIGLFVSADILRLDVVTKLINNLNLIAANTSCTWILIHHYRKPQEKGEEESVHKILGSSAWGNYCTSFLGLERAHKQRSMNFKRLHFLLRREESPEPMNLVRHPGTLLYRAIDTSEFYHISSVTVKDIVDILKQYEKGVSYTVITSEASTKFGVTKTRIQELLKEAQDLRLAYKEKGKFGRWFASEKTV